MFADLGVGPVGELVGDALCLRAGKAEGVGRMMAQHEGDRESAERANANWERLLDLEA